jgi:hypothetical protein
LVAVLGNKVSTPLLGAQTVCQFVGAVEQITNLPIDIFVKSCFEFFSKI